MSENKHMVDKNDRLHEEEVKSTVDRIPEEERGKILENFDVFKNYLGKRVRIGEKMGMSEEQLAKTAEKVADYLAENEEPRNREEKLLKELWNAGTEEQQHMLAHMLVRMVD
ncbi:DUF3243 domain-containing protein [Pseudalkalibacillus berkeleyi]|uniref:DUF3243 family protein n=1 Tax=Pseudalkalibacillus berkeleyi TaxID=1069813 RepID=A0ABS9GX14_9BACL|nr:DUF3243 domain-containing protein [Pseudalkalibacillus berkeleyi]MCF6136191.1 DUF3243 family protein [Pseudalkalibacillus berkeleyi]